MIAITASISESEKPPFLWLDAVDRLVIGVPPSHSSSKAGATP
jgi:hypothetical protein